MENVVQHILMNANFDGRRLVELEFTGVARRHQFRTGTISAERTGIIAAIPIGDTQGVTPAVSAFLSTLTLTASRSRWLHCIGGITSTSRRAINGCGSPAVGIPGVVATEVINVAHAIFTGGIRAPFPIQCSTAIGVFSS